MPNHAAPADSPPQSENVRPRRHLAEVGDGIAQIASHLTEEPSRIYARFLLVALAAILTTVGGGPTESRAFMVLTIVGLSFLGAVGTIVVGERHTRKTRRRKPKTRLAKLAVATAGVFSLSSIGLVVHDRGVLARALPGVYSTESCRAAAEDFFVALDGFLRAEGEESLGEAYAALAQTMSPRMRRDHLPEGSVEALTAWLDAPDSDARESLHQLAEVYRGWYGKVSGVLVESFAPESWRQLERSSQREVMHLAGVVRFTGRFLYNQHCESDGSSLKLSELAEAMGDEDSAARVALTEWIRKVFPDVDERALWSSMASLRAVELFEENAHDLLSFRVGADVLGQARDDQYLFGNEIVFYSVRLERDLQAGRGWQVDELGRWGLHRVFKAKPEREHVTLQRGRTELRGLVPYVMQSDPTYCQSAALAMLYEYRTGTSFPGGQEAIRADLERRGGATGHQSRVAWLEENLPDPRWSWEAVYEPAFGNAVSRIRRQLELDVPIVMSTRFTPSGHVIVVNALYRDSSGGFVVRAHDPWGRFDFQRKRYERSPNAGKDVLYPVKELVISNRIWRKSDGADFMSRYVVGTQDWSPTNAELIQGGATLVETLSDWEWMGVALQD